MCIRDRLLGQPVMYYSIKAFEDSPVDEIVIVCSADYIEYFLSLIHI